MSYILKYTSTKDTWSGAVKAGESFTVIQNTNAANGGCLKNHLTGLGRIVKSFSSLGGGGLDVGETLQFNEWTIERIK